MPLVMRTGPGLPGARTTTAAWLITFADLLSLLVSFFVLLFATTAVDQPAWRRVVEPVSAYFAGRRLEAVAVATVPATQAAPLDLAYLSVVLRRLAATDPGLAGAVVIRQRQAVALVLPQDVPLDHWMGAPSRLQALARLLHDIGNRVEITVHGEIGEAPAWRSAVEQASAIAAELHRLDGPPVLAVIGAADQSRGGAWPRVEIAIDGTGRQSLK